MIAGLIIPKKAYLAGALILALVAGGFWIKTSAVKSEREHVEELDKETAEGVENAVSEELDNLDLSDPDDVLRSTGGLRDD